MSEMKIATLEEAFAHLWHHPNEKPRFFTPHAKSVGTNIMRYIMNKLCHFSCAYGKNGFSIYDDHLDFVY